MKNPVCPVDFLVVELEKKFQDKIGSRFYLDTSYRPQEHATITGKVLTTPRWISDHPDVRQVVPEAKPGDEIIFSYLVVCDMDDHFSEPVHTNEFGFNGKSYWKVNYSLVLGYLRDGIIIPASGYVFLEPPEQNKELVKIGSLWIPPESETKKTVMMEAVVKHIGVPEKGKQPLPVSPGDRLFFDSRFVEKYTINEKKWLVLRQERIVGKKLRTANPHIL